MDRILINRFSFLLLIFTLSFSKTFSQATLFVQDFEAAPATPTMTFTNVNGGNFSASSAAGDRPATSPFFTSGSRGWGVANATSTLTFGNLTGLGACNTKYFEFRLAAFSIGSTGNGMESADLVTVEVSLDGGTAWSREITIGGNAASGNSYWAFAATGIASQTYDGDNTPLAFNAPSGGSNAAGHSTVRVNLPNACTQARIRITLLTNNAAERYVIDDVKLIATCPVGCTPDAQPTVEASTVTISEGCTSAQINFTNGDGTYRMIVMGTNCTITDPVDQTNYTSSSTFGSGNTTGAGDYVVYNGSAATTIVSGLTPGTSYCFKIYEYNGASSNCTENYLNATFSTTFTTLASCATPQIRSILVNACTVAEGTDEVVIIANGNSALDVDDIQIDFPSGGSFCNSGCGGQTFVNNASYVNDLNTLAGCALFIYATTIPANASVVVFTGSTPTMTFNYSSECPGGGPYYVLFCNNTNTAGRFANAADANRTLTVDFNGSTDAVTFYSSNANTGSDGDYVSFDNAGNPSYGNTAACSTPIILPVDWLNFNVESEKNTAILNWATQTERNNAYFDIEMANEYGQEFSKVGQVKGAGSSSQVKQYTYELNDIAEGYYYFRLRQVDFDGKSTFSETRSVSITGNEFAIKKITTDQDGTHFIMNEDLKPGSVIRLHEITGKLVHESVYSGSSNKIDIDRPVSGMLILSVEHPFDGISTFKVILP